MFSLLLGIIVIELPYHKGLYSISNEEPAQDSIPKTNVNIHVFNLSISAYFQTPRDPPHQQKRFLRYRNNICCLSRQRDRNEHTMTLFRICIKTEF